MSGSSNGSIDAPVEPVAVHVALARVIADMPGIGKDARGPVNQGGYAYRSIEAITTVVQPLFAKHGLIIVPKVTVISVDAAPAMKDGWQDTYIAVDWMIVGPDGSTIEARTHGVGRDNVDKGVNKAQTQAWKYLLLPLLCISDQKEDADGEHYDEGRRVEPPAEDSHAWRNLGWESEEAGAAAAQWLTEAITATTDAVRSAMRAWRKEQDFTWPYTPDQMLAVRAKLAEITAAQGTTPPGSAPQSPQDQPGPPPGQDQGPPDPDGDPGALCAVSASKAGNDHTCTCDLLDRHQGAHHCVICGKGFSAVRRQAATR